MRAVWVAAVVLAGALAAADAQEAIPGATPDGNAEMTPPRIIAATIDWDAVRAELAALPGLQSSGPEADGGLARLNAAAGRSFAGIEKSNVPVLLPLDPDSMLGANSDDSTARYRLHFFLAGPTGYDAAFARSDAQGPHEPLILISASSILYELDPPVAPAARPSRELAQTIPGIRRRWLENHLRYSFERYGVTYTVSMQCYQGPIRRRSIPCEDAAEVIVRFIRALRIAGGTPQPQTEPASTIDRPDTVSADFTYHPPGRLLPNTGFRGHGGKADTTVYARIRFPLARAPSYANSQSFLHWGNCDLTGRSRPVSSKGASYHCRVNNKPLVFDESHRENRSYPWRDNFCEHRRYFVGQCAGGEGHQGQDIRPATCQLRNRSADRCMPYRDEVVAVRDGMLLRIAGRESLYLFVNAPGERLRVRYLHMHPRMLDADGMLSGRVVREGDVLGKVGNYDRVPNGTTYHLHFELQVPTRDGWVFVNPYMTLVGAYERLIGGRGRQIEDDEPTISDTAPQAEATPAEPVPMIVAPLPRPRVAMQVPAHRSSATARAIVAAKPVTPARSPRSATAKEANARTKAATRACTEKVSGGRGKRICAVRQSGARAGAKPGVRKLGQPLPAARAGARRVGTHLHARDARAQARQVGIRTAR